MQALWLAAFIVAAGMGIGQSVAVVTAATGLGSASPGEGVGREHRLWSELIVRTPLSREHLDLLTDQVDRIWAPYGVTLEWRNGPPASLVPDGFSDWIRILIDRDATGYLGAGERDRPAIAAIHMPGGVPRNVIYVSLDAARTLVRHGTARPLQDWLVARIAGRAIAHELGHYLFGTSDHAEEGLMRSDFTQSDLLDPGLLRFQLSPIEAATLAERLFLRREGILAREGLVGGR